MSYGYTDVEIGKLTRLYDWMTHHKMNNNLLQIRKNFYRFFNGHDERRGTNFVKTFPEFEEFYINVKN